MHSFICGAVANDCLVYLFVLVMTSPRLPRFLPTPRRDRSNSEDEHAPRIGERLSGWISHAFSTSTTDLALYASPARRANAILTAAKHGKDKAVRYIFDSDATPDRCADPIWLLGVQHPGTDDTAWPPDFYHDFITRIWLTYRSGFTPIRDTRLSDLPAPQNISQHSEPQSPPRKWTWTEKGWTSDSGWGCMLRTAQSLLANALLTVHLGREWRRSTTQPNEYATYIRIITWFLDNPSPFCPFSVHRLALAGKELGKDVGMWFGPAAAAGGIRSFFFGPFYLLTLF